MDAHIIKKIQREGAEALLNAGVSLPLMDFKVPFRKTPLCLRVTMRRPTLGALLKIASLYLEMETTSEQLRSMTFDEQMAWLAKHGKKLSHILALTMPQRWLPTSVLSWVVRRWMKHEYQMAAMEKFVSLLGTDPFIPIIKSAEGTNPMKLRLSQRRKGS